MKNCSGLIIAAIACIIRPTDGITAPFRISSPLKLRCQGIIYLVLGLFTLATTLQSSFPFSNTLRLSIAASSIGFLALTVMALVDRHFYGSWTFPPLNFLRFNLLTVSYICNAASTTNAQAHCSVMQSEADVFGTHPWHWMFTAVGPSTSRLLTLTPTING
jgi:phosphatidylinositol glycan class B